MDMFNIFGKKDNSQTNTNPQEDYDFNRVSPILNRQEIEYNKNQFYIYMLDSVDMVEEIQHQLQGQIRSRDRNGNFMWEQKFKPLVNEDGIKQILNELYTLGLNKNTLLGNFTHDEIMYKCYKVKVRTAQIIAIKYEQFDIKKELRSLVVMIVTNTIHSSLSRCENGRLSRDLTKITTRIEHETQAKENQQAKANKGFIQSIFGGK